MSNVKRLATAKGFPRGAGGDQTEAKRRLNVGQKHDSTWLWKRNFQQKFGWTFNWFFDNLDEAKNKLSEQDMNTMLPVRKQILWLNIKVFSLVYCMFRQCCQTLRKSETNSFSGSNFLTVVAAPEDYITGDLLDRIQNSWEVWIIYEPTHTEGLK